MGYVLPSLPLPCWAGVADGFFCCCKMASDGRSVLNLAQVARARRTCLMGFSVKLKCCFALRTALEIVETCSVLTRPSQFRKAKESHSSSHVFGKLSLHGRRCTGSMEDGVWKT